MSDFVRLVTLLVGSYIDEGVGIWLSSPNRLLPACAADDCGNQCTPIHYIREGRIADVIRVAEYMTGENAQALPNDTEERA